MRPRVNILVLSIVALSIASAWQVRAQESQFALGASGGVVMNYGGDFFSFKPSHVIGAQFRFHPGGRWFLEFGYDHFSLKNDVENLLADSIGVIKNNDTVRFKSDRIGLSIGSYLFSRYKRLNASLAIDGAILLWKINDIHGDTTLQVRGPNRELTRLKASELTIGGSASISWLLSKRVSFNVLGRYEYLTGAGAEFESKVSSSRDRWLVTARAGFSLYFGRPAGKTVWPSDSAWAAQSASSKPKKKQSPEKLSATTDSDHDGVFDLYDDCPGTPAEAIGMVDIHGCPVDADFDGVPDYRDSCPNTPAGAAVTAGGCPLDSDGDGVPDGLDDCPDSPTGVPVDRFGCIDLSMFSKPIILNIDYLPGSFEIDSKTKDRLKKISGVLLLVPEVKLEIVGYTDNIGLPEANQKLSEKRANRVRDYLIAMGVPADRMKASGRGEENQIAPNDTAEGRTKNRRIEITFYR